MPTGPINIDEWSKKLKDVNLEGLGGRIKSQITKPRVAILAVIILAIIFFSVIVPFAGFYTDALWYNHLGFQGLFYKMLLAKILMVMVFGVFFFAILYSNVQVARKLAPKQGIDTEGSPLEEFVARARDAWGRLVGWLIAIFCIIAAFVAGMGWGGKWELVLRYLNHSSYGKKDPLFGKDIGYYLFSYPFIRELVTWLLGSLFFVFFVVAVIYVLEGGIRLKRGPDMLAPHVKAHLSVILAAILLVKAWSYRLNMYELLFTKDGVVWGAGYTDTHANLPALWILTILAIVAAVVLLANIKYRGWLLPVIAVGSLVVVTVLAGTVYPLIIQNYRVKPNERRLERPYLEHNIEFTREAYRIDETDVRPYAAEQALTLESIERNRATIRNVRLWSPLPLLDAYQQLQAIRQYYVFNDVDVDRYVVDGVYRQTLIGVRELLQANLPAAARTWVNNVLVYTHGYGAALSPSNDITSQGNPTFFLSDIPPEGDTNVQITRPEIYYGEKSSKYVITNSTEKEFDYSTGEKTEMTEYEGTGGVRMNSIWRKLLFAIRFSDINLILSSQVRDASQVMYVRTIAERVRKCAPFLKFDRDPYMVVDDSGNMVWIVDGYTTSDDFPYSQPTEGMGNYVRNSVKCTVSAYDGKVKIYVVDESDPVIETYRKIFPSIFTSFAKMPEDMRKHLRYPEDIFVAQANILRTYHMTDPDQFYSKEDEWDFPQEIFDSAPQMMSPYYVIMRLPEERGEEMVLFIPFTPRTKQNMISWFGARMDGEHYGELVNYRFPRGRLVYGPEQIEGRIEQDPEISRQLSLWRQEGSEVVRGNLLVIPIDQSIIYVEPLYLQATQIKIPQIKRVVVAYGEQIVMEPTLDLALNRVFGAAQPATPPTAQPEPEPEPVTSTDVAALAAQASDLYNKAIEAQRVGDWAAYGEYLKQLEGVLSDLGKAAKVP